MIIISVGNNYFYKRSEGHREVEAWPNIDSLTLGQVRSLAPPLPFPGYVNPVWVYTSCLQCSNTWRLKISNIWAMYCTEMNTMLSPSAYKLFSDYVTFSKKKKGKSFSPHLFFHKNLSFWILFILKIFLFYSSSLPHHLPSNQTDNPSHFLPSRKPNIHYSGSWVANSKNKETHR